MMIISPSPTHAKAIIDDLNAFFPVKDLGPIHDFLGMEIIRAPERKTFRLRQLGLIDDTLSYARPLKRVQNIPLRPEYDIFAKSDPLAIDNTAQSSVNCCTPRDSLGLTYRLPLIISADS